MGDFQLPIALVCADDDAAMERAQQLVDDQMARLPSFE
jgi:hypothetical protein